MSENKVVYFSPETQINIDDIKRFIAPNATDKELFLLINIAKTYGLSPFKREVHFVKYGNAPASIITGYEIYLKRAERTGKLDGWKCWIEKDDVGEKAVIEIKRKDQTIPVRWEVYRKEFDKAQSTWKSMPTFMLKKVAIAQGFRLAFPDDLGGMPYIPEEMPQDKGGGLSEALPKEVLKIADHPTPDVSPIVDAAVEEPIRLATKDQVARIQIIMKERGLTDRKDILDSLTAFCGRDIFSSKTLTFDEAHAFISEAEMQEGRND